MLQKRGYPKLFNRRGCGVIKRHIVTEREVWQKCSCNLAKTAFLGLF
jgi:hypothetical protein